MLQMKMTERLRKALANSGQAKSPSTEEINNLLKARSEDQFQKSHQKFLIRLKQAGLAS